MPMYQCDYLIEFAVVARERSFSKAALRLSASQSSLSRHVRSLEAALHMQLLERHADGVCLTPDGRFVYTKVAGILDTLEEIEFYASSRRECEDVTVGGIVGIFPCYYTWIKECVEDLPWKGGHLACHMLPHEETSPAEVRSALEQGQMTLYVDVNLAPLEGELGPDVIQVEIAHPRFLAVMEARNPLAVRGELVAADLADRLLLHSESNFHHARQCWASTKAILRAAGVRYRAEARPLEREADYYRDFDEVILLLPEGYKSIELLRSIGKVVVPVSDLHFTLAAFFRADDERARAVVDALLAREPAGPAGVSGVPAVGAGLPGR